MVKRIFAAMLTAALVSSCGLNGSDFDNPAVMTEYGGELYYCNINTDTGNVCLTDSKGIQIAESGKISELTRIDDNIFFAAYDRQNNSDNGAAGNFTEIYKYSVTDNTTEQLGIIDDILTGSDLLGDTLNETRIWEMGGKTFVFMNYKVYIIDGETVSELPEQYSSVCLDKNKIYYHVAGGDNKLCSYDALTGKNTILWKQGDELPEYAAAVLGGGFTAYKLSVSNDRLYFIMGAGAPIGWLCYTELDSPHKIYMVENVPAMRDYAVDGSGVIYYTTDRGVYSFDGNDISELTDGYATDLYIGTDKLYCTMQKSDHRGFEVRDFEIVSARE